VVPAGLARDVGLQAAWVADADLAGDEGDGARRHLARVVEEDAERAHDGQLKGEAEPVVIAPATADERMVAGVEEEPGRKLVRSGLASKAPVGADGGRPARDGARGRGLPGQ
jgi:hypothetical protein